MPSQRDGFCDPSRGLFQFERDIAAKVGASSHAPSASPPATGTAEKILKYGSTEDVAKGFKNIADISETGTAASCFDTCMTILVIPSAFLGIAQDFVSFGCLFEFVHHLCIALVRIWVILDGELTICFGNVVLRR
jgi:hypothetical protein